MSQYAKKLSTGSIGQSKARSASSRTSFAKRTSSSAKTPGKATNKGPCMKKAVPTQPKVWTLPAFSVPFNKKSKADEYLQKYKQKTIRRNAPPGEDMKGIKDILASVKGNKDITVQELISLVGPYTGDQGDAFRIVMNEDLNSFRNLAKKVYETITQDSSDVLLNQQLQLSEYYKEKKTLLQDKMMRAIEEIYSLVPKFDFDRYQKEKENYLAEVLPMPKEFVLEPEEIEMMKRQAAYHRLQWLRSEGERLTEENNALKKRLGQMKKMHREEQERLMDKEREAEAKKEALDATEAEKIDTLEMLNESIEQTIVGQEITMRMKADMDVGKGAKKKQLTQKSSKGKLKKKTRWNEKAAWEIEGRMNEEQRISERRNTSPFHYSPSRSPVMQTPPQECTPVQELQSEAKALPTRTRVGQGPKDTWGGYY